MAALLVSTDPAFLSARSARQRLEAQGRRAAARRRRRAGLPKLRARQRPRVRLDSGRSLVGALATRLGLPAGD